MLTVHRSNDLEQLADALAAQIRARAGAWGLLEPTVLAVPNATTRRWLSLALARRLGVSPNLAHGSLHDQLQPSLGASLMGEEVVTLAILDHLGADALTEPVHAPLRSYLGLDRQPPAGEDERERRRVQLASRLAQRFLELDSDRPSLIAAWESGDPAPVEILPSDAVQADHEPWLRALWKRVFDSLQGWERPGQSLVGLEGSEANRPLHVFGFAPLGSLERSVVLRLARQREVHVYRLDPARSSLLSLWEEGGHPDWSPFCAEARVELVVNDLPVPKVATTLLAMLQNDLLGGATQASAACSPDGSLEITTSATPQREVEAAAERIWASIQATPDLRFDEIAVVLPRREREAYASHVVSVFAEAGGIPLSLRGVVPPGTNRLAQAAALLLDFPLAERLRDELLGVVTHPSVLPENADPDLWREWCRHLGVFQGFDQNDLAGTYIPGDLHTWSQALRRLSLGAFAPGGGQAELVGGDLPAPLQSDQLEQAGTFVTLVRSLIADARFARTAQLPLRDWARFLHGLLVSYVTPTDEESGLWGRLLSELRGLEDVDATGTPVGYHVAHALARGRLRGLSRVSRGPREGVAVTTLSQARGLPYRVVIVLGLGEHGFPANPPADVLDLRAAAPQPGERTPAQRDRYGFLELLASARDALVLSYVDRDTLTGEPLLPSPVVHELQGALTRGGYLAKLPLRVERLRRYDPRYLPAPLGVGPQASVLSEAWAEARSVALRTHLKEEVGDRLLPTGRARLAALDASPRATLRTQLRLTTLGAASLPRSGDRLRLSLSAVRRFVESPLQAWTQYRLGLREPVAPLSLHEPFSPDRLTESGLLTSSFWAGVERIRAGEDPSAALQNAYAERATRAEREARLPTGLFREVLRERHLSVLHGWLEVTESLMGPEALEARPVHLGTGEPGAGSARPPLFVAVSLPGDSGPVHAQVELVGTTDRVLPNAAGLFRLTTGSAKDRLFVRGFLDHVVLAAAGAWEGTEPFSIWACPHEPPKRHVDVDPLTPDAAQDYLRTLLEAFLGHAHDYFLPLDAALPFLRAHLEDPSDDPEGDLAAHLAKCRSTESWLASDWGPARNPRKAPAPHPAVSLAEERFQIYLEHTEEVKHSRRPRAS